jgi:phosphotransferase system HPr-like phosphotransfer protein
MAAHERAENEFWSVFLSYQMPGANGAATKGGSQLMDARRRQETCPLQRQSAQPVEVARNSQSSQAQVRAKREARRSSVQANSAAAPETVESASDDAEATASLYTYTVRPVVFSEKEQKALKAAGMHARDTEKLADLASKATLASFLQENQNMRIKARQLMDMDKLQRQRNRYTRDRIESSDETPAPNPIGSM